jgi:uncharacterized protein YjbJ (UPF0337 family)
VVTRTRRVTAPPASRVAGARQPSQQPRAAALAPLDETLGFARCRRLPGTGLVGVQPTAIAGPTVFGVVGVGKPSGGHPYRGAIAPATNNRAIEGDEGMKSARRDKAEGTVDKIAGRVLEALGKVTGNRSTRAKGKAARGRGVGRSTKGRVKRG